MPPRRASGQRGFENDGVTPGQTRGQVAALPLPTRVLEPGSASERHFCHPRSGGDEFLSWGGGGLTGSVHAQVSTGVWRNDLHKG